MRAAAIGLLAIGCTCSSEPASTSRPAEPATDEARFAELGGDLAWHADPPLVSRRPSSAMRAAEYGVTTRRS